MDTLSRSMQPSGPGSASLCDCGIVRLMKEEYVHPPGQVKALSEQLEEHGLAVTGNSFNPAIRLSTLYSVHSFLRSRSVLSLCDFTQCFSKL